MSWRPAALFLGSALLVLAASSSAVVHVQAGEPADARNREKGERSVRRHGREPVELALALAATQFGISRGDSVAFERQGMIAADVDRRLRALKSEAWQDPRNREGLIKIVLSGGDPAILGRLIESGGFPPEEMALAEGAVAFATGKRGAAVSLLGEVDHVRLSAILAGHVALVKAVLATGNDPIEALSYCLEARLLSPGTHVEEAALRLAIELAITIGDEARFGAAAANYLLRFPGSIYASSVVPRLARVMGAIDFLGQDKGERLLATLDLRLAAEYRNSFYQEMSEAALRSGKLASAIRAGQRVVVAAPESAWAAAQAHAVIGAARIAAGEIAEGRRELDAADFVPAESNLKNLIEAARSVADFVLLPPARELPTAPGQPAIAETSTGVADVDTSRPPGLPGKVATVVSTARARLNDLAKLMKVGEE